MFFFFFIPLIIASDWCEYQKLETHYANTTKYWGEYVWNNFTCVSGSCTKPNPIILGSGGIASANITKYNYCPNATLNFSMSGIGYLYLCGVNYNAGYTTNVIINPEICGSDNITYNIVGGYGGMGFYSFNMSCDFKNSPVGSGITDEFYAYPKVYTEMGSLPNETYPNVTYRIKMNMTDYTPSCSDYDNINKYGLQTSTPYSVYPRDIGWIEQTTSCVGVDNQTIEQPHYSFINQTLQGGCKALVNYQNATLNCELIKYNTTIGSDTPTMTIISPLNDTSIPIYNPISFAVNMSNNKCLDVYVVSTKSGYSKLTILNSTDGYYYNGIDNLPNGTYTTNFICDDGCYGVYAHNVTNPIYFQVSRKSVV